MTDTSTPATGTTASVSTHVLDTSAGRPARGVAVRLAARSGGRDAPWRELGGSATDADGRCRDLPVPPEGTTHVRLDFAVEPYLARREEGTVFFPEVTVTFAVVSGEHYHVPLLLNPFGYSVYRGS
jgi:5-hydroxyisourate hydrolase